MINLYRSISEKILEIVSVEEIDYRELEVQLEKRQELINSLIVQEIDRFREIYISNGLYEYDKEIKIRLKKHMLAVRKDISEYKLNKKVNTTYVNMNKNNFSIFSKKV